MKVSKNINFIAIMIVLSLVCLLNACGTNNKKESSSTPTPASPGAVSGNAVSGNAVSGSAASGAVVSEGMEKTEKEAKTVTVTDETGEKCTLKLDRSRIDFSDVGVTPSNCDIGNVVWNQVYKNDFYYVCYTGKTNFRDEGGFDAMYTIYKNHGQMLGVFMLGNDEFPGHYWYTPDMCIYKDRLYCFLNDDGIGQHDNIIGYIDLRQKKPIILYNVHTNVATFIPIHVYGSNFYDTYSERIIYGDKIFYEGKDRNFTASLFSLNMKQGNQKEVITKMKTVQSESNWFLMDGKIYFVVEKGKLVSLYSFDLESKRKTKILTYNCFKKLKGDPRIEIDEQYIYSQKFIIPLKGGKMVRKDLHDDYLFVHNDKYIFYIDSKYKLHRVDKGNLQKDKIISKEKFCSVHCTDKELYLRKYDKQALDFLESEDSYYFPELFRIGIYVMDFQGKEKMRNFYGKKEDEE
ncbi:MAG: hypothetical protein J5988_08205 [Eubacterium sp.]|nr:hypothetical protein [Eubacterium sp.]